MARWRIYYDSGATYSDVDGPIENAPCDGVVIIAQADEVVGREILHLKDYYYWERGRWWGADLYGRDDYLRRPGWKKVLAGRNTEYENYTALYKRAGADPELPQKNARHLTERPMR